MPAAHRAVGALLAGLAAALAAGAGPASVPAWAEGDLAVKAQELEPLMLGSDESDYDMSVTEYRLETGKAYSWTISSYGFKDYTLVAPEFFRNVWLRSIEAEGVEIKAPTVDAIEFEEGEKGEIELTFVPIRPRFGDYEFRIRGLEQKGMVGKIIVK